MKLDAWLRQDHSLGERLRLVECLCQAVNAVHDKGEALAALEPGRVDVAGDGQCDLGAARKGSPSRDYLSPDRAEGGQPSSIADVYAAGAIAWEILVGRAPGTSPTHLAEIRPEVPREVADAVMACLERSPEWRPKDLTYLAQIAAAKQPAAGRAVSSPRAARAARTARTGDRRPVRRTWPLLAALVVVLALAAAAGWRYLGPSSPGRVAVPGRPTRPTPSPPVVEPTAPTPPTAAPAVASSGGTTPVADPLAAFPRPAPEGADAAAFPVPAPTLAPTPMPTPTPTPRLAPPTGPTGEAPPPAPRRPAASGPERADAVPAGPVPVAPPAVPAELTAVSPLTVSRPGKVLLDLRGTSLGPTHRVAVVPLKRAPSGITVVRQKLVSDTLIAVLLDLDDSVSPGEYGVVVEGPGDLRSNVMVFTVTK